MKNIIFFSVLFLGIFVENSFSAKMPKWINDSKTECSENNICAVGSGNTMSSAKTDARNNILKFFETNLSSTFVSNISANDTNVTNFQSENSMETTDGILRGVTIEKTFENDKQIFYALAVLNKNIAEKEIKNDIDKIDSKMQILFDEKNSKYTKELERLYKNREGLNRKYLVLTGNMVPEIFKSEDIFIAHKENRDLTSVFFITEYEDYKNQIASYIKNSISSDGYNITTDKNKANKIIVVNLNQKDLYLNVDGFKKEMYSIKIDVLNKEGQLINSLFKEFIQTGRSEKQIFEIINMEIKNFISENLNSLI